MKNSLIITLLFCCIAPLLHGQKLSGSEIRAIAHDEFSGGVEELIEFLKLSNIGSDPEQVAQNLEWCRDRFNRLSFDTQIIKTEGAPLLFAEKMISDDKKTILFYLQIDGQPVDPSEWDQADPFIPVIKEKDEKGMWKPVSWDRRIPLQSDWRIFGRSASDSKGPAMAFITALDYFHQKSLETAWNIKVIMDFQEELGSPTLARAVEENKSLLDADMVLIMDGTRHISNWPTLTYGARGIATATIKIFGPSSPLHSGQYGNYAPNPVFAASRFIASLKDEKGHVLIPGFYDGIVLSDQDKIALRSLPENEDSLKMVLGISKSEAVGNNYQESLQYPSLNIRGLRSAWVGKEVRTIIPEDVEIEIDMRLVPETPGERMVQLLEGHLRKEGFYLVDSIPTAEERSVHPKIASMKYRLGSQPFRTDMNSETGEFLNRALGKVFGKKVVNMRTTGGSQPIAPFVKTMDVPAVSIRIPNPDNSIHAPNENLRLGNFLEGIMMCMAILNEPN
ncbi:MAG: M20/M25/M40 family metallo-hydrolase [Flavobacteriaceae bacterium]|nr:M20/M25/M40 family metallo-hydrolase [Muriicola sp.]NNL40527.1 M20/M25/M40 family metallo-hydrolase [Flavobacteriaceae bacterium]